MSFTYRTEALIIRRKPFREADRLIVVLTPDRGKLELIARGAAKMRSKLAAHLEPFLHTQLLIAQGKSYDTVAASTVRHRFNALSQSLVRKAWADYTAELLEHVIQVRQADPMIFNLTYSTWQQFERLAVTKKRDYYHGFLFLVAFVIKLMSRIGYQPSLHRCVICQRRLQPDGNTYYFSLGGIVCQRCQAASARSGSHLAISGAAIRTLRYVLRQTYASIGKLRVSVDQLAEVKSFIDKFVTYHTEYTPQSQRFVTWLLRRKPTV
ncbi:MAG: DNA repair protein RecO [Patescibacteria group bacterium]